MKLCNVDNKCIHRFACKRWVWNYRELPFGEYIPPKDCLNDSFGFLIRFRTSEKRGLI